LELSTIDIELLNSQDGLKQLLKSKKLNMRKILNYLRYEKELRELQTEAIKLQNWITNNNKRLVILYEGRDSAGKGGAIRRFVEHLNPRRYKVVALPKPTIKEKGQWYFQRYAQRLPDPGEIVLFDRSWYNRAIVEPVNGFCNQKQYKRHLEQIPEFEKMLKEDGTILIKLWFSISKQEQKKRLIAIKKSPLKQWKLSPVDEKAQELWDVYTQYKEEMFSRTNTKENPWIVVMADSKINARVESMKYILEQIPYAGKSENLEWNRNVIVQI
jgi:polyphosphate kinase 2